MRIINLYQETLGIVSDCCKVSKEKIILKEGGMCECSLYSCQHLGRMVHRQ